MADKLSNITSHSKLGRVLSQLNEQGHLLRQWVANSEKESFPDTAMPTTAPDAKSSQAKPQADRSIQPAFFRLSVMSEDEQRSLVLSLIDQIGRATRAFDQSQDVADDSRATRPAVVKYHLQDLEKNHLALRSFSKEVSDQTVSVSSILKLTEEALGLIREQYDTESVQAKMSLLEEIHALGAYLPGRKSFHDSVYSLPIPIDDQPVERPLTDTDVTSQVIDPSLDPQQHAVLAAIATSEWGPLSVHNREKYISLFEAVKDVDKRLSNLRRPLTEINYARLSAAKGALITITEFGLTTGLGEELNNFVKDNLETLSSVKLNAAEYHDLQAESYSQ